MKQDRRGSWYLLTGAVLGIALGIFYSWMINPVKYVDAPPYALRADFKDDYRALVAAAYLYSSDLVRAQSRLALLKDENIAQTLEMQAQRALAEGHPAEEVRALGILAKALSQGMTPAPSTIVPKQSSTPIQPTSESSPTVSASDTTLTSDISLQIVPTSTQGEPFGLQESRLVRSKEQTESLIQVEIRDTPQQQASRVDVVVTREGGEDHFFTGLKPELDLGYADFAMTPDVVYSLHLTNGGQTFYELIATDCLADDGSHSLDSRLLTFNQP